MKNTCEKFILFFVFCMLFFGITSTFATETNIEFILDGSNSMNEKAGDESKITSAKRVLLNLIENWAAESPENLNIGLRVYGHNFDPTKGKDAACMDTKIEVPIKGVNLDDIKSKVNSVKAKGYTPIAYTLEQTISDFKGMGGQNNIVILVSDGKESCGGDPCAVAKKLHASGIAVKINVVGFDVTGEEKKQLSCIAEAAGGKYYNAKNVSEFKLATEEIKKDVETHVQKLVKPKESGNLIEKSSGGRLVTATKPSFAKIGDGDINNYTEALWPGDEAVFAFKDNRLAKIKSVAFPIFKTDKYNPKEIEILISAESPVSGFTSLGNIELTNMVFMDNPFQEFEFDPVEARYIKFKIVSVHGGSQTYLYEAKVLGELLGEETAAAPMEKPKGTDLLAAKNGGRMIVATKPSMKNINDGNENNYTEALWPGDEAVFAFKNNAIAEINAVAIPIWKTDKFNPKEIEILVSTDENPTKGFTPVGTTNLQNLAFMDDPYQTFTFEPVRARYIKFKIVSAHGGSQTYLYEVKVLGELLGEETAMKPAEKPKGTDLLAAKNGGRMIVATKPSMKNINDGNENNYTEALWSGDEAVFAFRDNAIAEINAVAIPIWKTDKFNPKEIEIQVSTDENPTKGFTPVGTTNLQNLAFMDDPYQTFTFEPVRARYIKFKIVSAHGGSQTYLYEVKVLGELLGEETAVKPAEKSKGTDLLAAKNGGKIIVATKPSMKNINDGNENNYTEALWPGDEAVFAFKNNAIAEINAVAIPIWKTDKFNPKEIEIMVSTDKNPTKGFTSLGTMNLQNIAFMDDPYQTFTFEPVKARYIKFKIVSAHGGSQTYLYEAKVFGEFPEE